MKKLGATLCAAVCAVLCAASVWAQDNREEIINYCYALHDRFMAKDAGWVSAADMALTGNFRVKEGASLFTVKVSQRTVDDIGGYHATLSFYREAESAPFQTVELEAGSFGSITFSCMDIDSDGFEELVYPWSIGSGGTWYGFVRYDQKARRFERFDPFTDGLAGRDVATGNSEFCPGKKLMLCSHQSGWGNLTYTLYSVGKGCKLTELYTLETNRDGEGQLLRFELREPSRAPLETSVPWSYTVRQAERELYATGILPRMERYF